MIFPLGWLRGPNGGEKTKGDRSLTDRRVGEQEKNH